VTRPFRLIMNRTPPRNVILVRSIGDGQNLGQAVKECQKGPGEGIGDRHARSHRKGTKSEGKNPPHINPMIDSSWRRNGEYMSVTSNRNKSNRMFDRECNDRSNRWQDSDSGTDSRSGFREFIKACMQSTRH